MSVMMFPGCTQTFYKARQFAGEHRFVEGHRLVQEGAEFSSENMS